MANILNVCMYLYSSLYVHGMMMHRWVRMLMKNNAWVIEILMFLPSHSATTILIWPKTGRSFEMTWKIYGENVLSMIPQHKYFISLCHQHLKFEWFSFGISMRFAFPKSKFDRISPFMWRTTPKLWIKFVALNKKQAENIPY